MISRKIVIAGMKYFLLIFAFCYSTECFSQNYAGITTAGTTSYPNGGLQRIGSYVFTDTSVHSLYTAVIDETRGYAYFGTTSSPPGEIAKVSLGTADAPPTLVATIALDSGESGLVSSVIDPANGYAYFGAIGKIVKVALGAGTTAPTEIATLTLNTGGGSILGGAIDTAAGYAYFSYGGNLTKIALGAGTAAPTLIGTSPLSSGNAGRRVAIDVNSGTVYVSSYFNVPGIYDKFTTGGSGSPSFLGTVSLPENYLGSMALDTIQGYGYIGTYEASSVICGVENDTTPGKIMKIALGGNTTASPVYIGEIAVPEMHFTNIVTDPVSGFMMVGNDLTYPASNVIKVAMGMGSALPTEVGSIQLYVGPSTLNVDTCPAPTGSPLNGEIFIQSGLIDPTQGYTYWGTDTWPGQVVKVRYSEKGVIKGTQISLDQSASVTTINFYSQTASGNINLAIYDNSSPNNLLWQSGTMANTTANNWISVPISSGSTTSLTLPAGTYWLAWQTDSNSDVPSYTLGTTGQGFVFAQSYGAFPTMLSSPTLISETWSEYITYSPSVIIKDWNLY